MWLLWLLWLPLVVLSPDVGAAVRASFPAALALASPVLAAISVSRFMYSSSFSAASSGGAASRATYSRNTTYKNPVEVPGKTVIAQKKKARTE